MQRLFCFSLFLFASLFPSAVLFAQNAPTTQDVDFWVSFPFNFTDTTDMRLIITSERNCSGTATNPQTGWSTSFNIPAHSVVEVKLPADQCLNSYRGSSRNTGIHVVTTDTISLYASSYENAAFDVTNVLPTKVLRDEYIAQTYKSTSNGSSELLILATEDGTSVDITVSCKYVKSNTIANPGTYNITLQKGQTHLLCAASSCDLSGTRVVSKDCKPIAVFASNSLGMVPVSASGSDNCCGDFLFEQLFPVAYHGTKFVITGSLHRVYDRIKITSDENGCEVWVNGVRRSTLSASSSAEFEVTSNAEPVYIETSKPVQVFLYFTGGQYYRGSANPLGDPSMVMMAPLEQQLSKITFTTFQTSNTNNHYVNIVTSTATKSGMTLDGNSISYAFTPVRGATQYSYARIPLSHGSHTLMNTKGVFLAHVYGLGEYESYSYSVGSTAASIKSSIYVSGNLWQADDDPVQICKNESLSFKIESNYEIANVFWNFGDGTTTKGANVIYTFRTPGSYNVRAVIEMKKERCGVGLYDTVYAKVIVKPFKTADFPASICEGEFYPWHGISYAATGSYSYSTKGSNGCDSTVTLKLKVYANTSSSVYEECVQNELPHRYNGKSFSDDVSTSIVIPNAAGCDSTINYTLHVWKNVSAVVDSTVCENDLPLTWNNVRFTRAAVKSTTLQGAHGVDSVLRMMLNVATNTTYEKHQSVVENDLPVSFAGINFTKPQQDTTIMRVNAAGCDSIITYSLKVFANTTNVLDSTICENQLPLVWNGHRFTDDGTYSVKLKCQNGADSMVTMKVHVLRNSRSVVRDTVVQNALPYSFNGLSFKASHADTVIKRTNAAGCDSLITFSLKVWDNVKSNDFRSICENELPYTWNNVRFTSSAVKSAKLTGVHGEDSVVTMMLEVKRNSSYIFSDAVVENSLPYRFAGLSFYDAQRDTVLLRVNKAGCDSNIHFSLTVYKNVYVYFDSVVCENSLPVVWNGIRFDDADSSSTIYPRSNGADSVIKMRVFVNRNTSATFRDTIVENSLPYAFAGLTFRKTQKDTTFLRRNRHGCDSVIHFSLKVWNNVATMLDTNVCENFFPITLNGKRFVQASVKSATLSGSHGEDSVVNMRVGMLKNSASTYADTVVENSLPVSFAGLYFNDTQHDTAIMRVNAAGCDSVIRYSLLVYHNKYTYFDSARCENDVPFVWNGVTFSRTDSRSTKLVGSHGEDSVVTMRFTMLRNTAYSQHDTIVQNSLPHRFANITFSDKHADTTFVRVNAAGCDSVITYSLHVWYNVSHFADSTLCENYMPFTWNDKRFVAQGVKQVTLVGAHGVDSVLTMRVNVLNNTSSAYSDTVVQNNLPVSFAGLSFSTMQRDTSLIRVNAAGCDSVISYSLFVYYNKQTYLDSARCENDVPFVWNGVNFSRSDSRSTTLVASHGEDSVVTMRFTMLRNTAYSQHDTIVQNSLPHRFSNITFSDRHADTTFVRVNAAGCDSVITYSLHVWYNVKAFADSTLCENYMPLTWNDKRFVSPGVKQVTLVGAHGVDSVLTMRVNVLNNTSSQYSDTVVQNSLPVSFAGLTFNKMQSDTSLIRVNADGCDSVIRYSLFVYHNVTTYHDSACCQNFLPMVWNNVSFASSRSDSVVLTGVHGEDSTVVMRFNVLNNTYRTYRDTVVQNDLPHRFDSMTFPDRHDDTTFVRVNAAGCDSIITYSLHVWYNVKAFADSTLCENYLPLLWNNKRFTNDGVMQSTLIGSHGQDSLLTMRVGVLRNTYYEQHDTIVENSLPHSFTSLSFRQAQRDTLIHRTNVVGCDSVITYSLHVWRNVSTYHDSAVCQNYLPLVWNGVSFSSSRSDSVVFTGAHGEDSTVVMSFVVLRNTSYVLHDTVVENSLPVLFDTINFYDRHADTTFLRVNADGCDSVITYSLHVWYNVAAMADSHVCQNFLPLVWNDVTFTNDAVKQKMLVGSHGEDSLLTMRFFRHDNTISEYHDTVVENSLPVRFADLSFTWSQPDTVLLRRNVWGCDSFITYSLHVYPNVTVYADSSVCQNFLPLSWNGKTFTTNATQSATLLQQNGADSVVVMTLDVMYNTYFSQHDTVVENHLPVFFDTLAFYQHHPDTVFIRPNANGCDSVITYSLHVWYNIHNNIDSVVCENYFPLMWNGVRFMGDSLVGVTFYGSHGEDSIVGMQVIKAYNTYYEQHDTLVENRIPHTFAGVVFYTSQSDTVLRRVNTAGCDSLITYSLHVWQNYHTIHDTSICNDALPIVWRDSLFAASGVKRHLFSSIHGSDSLVTLRLVAHEVYDTAFAKEICASSFYKVGAKRFRNEGHYDVMLRSIYDCDSAVHLDLTVYDVFYNDSYDTICDNASVLFEGINFNKQGVYPVFYDSRDGCDSVLTLHLIVRPSYCDTDRVSVCYGNSLKWMDSVVYRHSTVTPVNHYFSVHGCDSIWHLDFFVDRPVQASINASPQLVTFDNSDIRLSDVSHNVVSRQWLSDGVLLDTSDVFWLHYPLDRDSMLVTLAVESGVGCTDTASFVLRRDAIALYAPNAFTPNLPSNNRFYFSGNDILDFKAYIYSRQGILVATLNDLGDSWDGTFRGSPCPQGAYVYVAYYTPRYNPKSTLTMKGSVTLLR